jgi:SynChlorMet cassette radical SAM/SPASM protein ScmE
MYTPRMVEIDITNKCNLRCKYCSHFSSAGDTDKDLPAREWLKFFTELKDLAVMNLCICGGEPFLRDDLKELIEGIVRNRMRFCILSNGTLITDSMAKFLAACGRCDYVQVSIDGSMPTTHDAMRGKGSFQKAIEGLKALKKSGVITGVRVTIHRKNVHDLEGIAKLLLEDVGLQGFGTNSASHMGLCRANAEMVQLTPEERTIAMKTLLKLNKKYKNRIGAAAGPLAEARMWLDMEKARRENRKDSSGTGRLVACGGVNNKIAVRADGVITPCVQMSHIELGRINRDSLEDIWQSHPELNRLRARRDIRLSSFEYCKDCAYVNYCTGNCPALAYTLSGRDDRPSLDACLRRFLEEGGRLPDLKLIRSRP